MSPAQGLHTSSPSTRGLLRFDPPRQRRQCAPSSARGLILQPLQRPGLVFGPRRRRGKRERPGLCHDCRRREAVPESTTCGVLDVDAESVDFPHDRHRCRESESGRSEPSKSWRTGAGRSSDRLGGQLGVVWLSATWRHPSCWAPREGGPSAGPLGQGELPVASSSAPSCQAWSSAVAAMMTLQWRMEATTRTTPTCRSSPLPRWQRRRCTTAPVTGLHRRRRHTPPPSTC
jgi:hypothetical protein